LRDVLLLLDQLVAAPGSVCDALRQVQGRLRNPPLPMPAMLDWLSNACPRFVAEARTLVPFRFRVVDLGSASPTVSLEPPR
jgi:hypothetical protein